MSDTLNSISSHDTKATEIYTLSLHDALPILRQGGVLQSRRVREGPHRRGDDRGGGARRAPQSSRSEEHTSELQSRRELVCRLLLEKKKRQCHWPSAGITVGSSAIRICSSSRR